MSKSNLNVSSNVMPVPDNKMDEIKHLPGDLAVLIYMGVIWPSIGSRVLTPRQYQEYLQYLVCYLCKKTCAGTCQRA